MNDLTSKQRAFLMSIASKEKAVMLHHGFFHALQSLRGRPFGSGRVDRIRGYMYIRLILTYLSNCVTIVVP